ncbi:phospholipase D-like domain-containing protein [Saccharicrinis aurantiacus]|uniref:phospholipase D-like domain-containing protein n=1 Tax=Saccharicrinis aurantiacus TaxID=1849719 RepID=UPI002491AEB6|nr:phospholipase D-like domain-containing protein [Saccharicrinis aurantiacus]
MNIFKQSIIGFTCFISLFFSSCEKEVSIELEYETPINITVPKAIFNNPNTIANQEKDRVIFNTIIDLINAVPTGEEIYFSVYLIDTHEIADALIDADERGVKVNLMIDFSVDESTITNKVVHAKLIQHFDSGITVVNNVTSSSINHNKYVALSAITTASGIINNVVLQTSSNMHDGATAKLQDALVISDETIYQGYASYHQDVMQLCYDADLTNYRYREVQSNTYEAAFFPRRKGGSIMVGDNYMEALDKITHPESAVVSVGMSLWTANRMNVIERLEELAIAGASIKIITKTGNDAAVNNALLALEKYGVEVKIFKTSEINIHSKYMLIKTNDWEYTLTGSGNLTQNALSNNNEAIITTHNTDIYKAYIANFNQLWQL